MDLTTAQVAKELGLSTRQVRNLAEEGKLACSRTEGGHRRFKAEDVAVLREQRENNHSPSHDGISYPRKP